MGASPKLNFVSLFFYQKSLRSASICNPVEKWKEIDEQVAHDFFFKVMGALKKKNDGRTMGAAPMI